MDRSNHYEAALEGYLQWHRMCYVAVDEARRSLMGDNPVKSLDFIVFGRYGTGLLVDVKGRKFPAGFPRRPRRVWECWSTEEDVASLERWQELFGVGFQALFVFAYEIMTDACLPGADKELWTWHGRRYLYRAVPVSEYRPWVRPRSRQWRTIELPGNVFRELARPLEVFTKNYRPATAECPF